MTTSKQMVMELSPYLRLKIHMSYEKYFKYFTTKTEGYH